MVHIEDIQMTRRYTFPCFIWAALLLCLSTGATSSVMADEGDPPTRIARLAFAEGMVSLQPGGTDEWVQAEINRPVTTGDGVWVDRDSRAELQLDGSQLRLAAGTSVSFLNVGDNITQIQLTSGTLIVRLRRLDSDEGYEIDTPNLALSLLQPGLYRISIDDSGSLTTVGVRSGQAEVTGGGADFPVASGQQVLFRGTDTLAATIQPYGLGSSPFDTWSASRDARWDHSASARYVSDDVVGFADLDDQGDWNSTPDYGYVWFPRGVGPGWAPYHDGHWAYIAPWGYTWVDDQPWGFAPFHYGRWISVRGAWGWVPCPPRPPRGEVYVRPVYSPALVAWVGGGAGVAWFALGPREVYVPSYPVSRTYVTRINVSNTVVNTTVVNNIYNTTIINNRGGNVTDIRYVNRGVRGAVTATTAQAFASAQPVASHAVEFDPRANTRVQVFAPPTVPTRQAVFGRGRMDVSRPPAALRNRAVVARTTPPPPLPSFERRQQAIQQNGGRPLSVTEVRQIQPQVPQRIAPIRIAPPAAPGSSRPSNDASPGRFGAPPQREQPVQAQQQAARQDRENQQRAQLEQEARRQQQQQLEQQRQQEAQRQARQQQAAEQDRERQQRAQQEQEARRQQQQQLEQQRQQEAQQQARQQQAAEQDRERQQHAQQEQEARRQQQQQLEQQRQQEAQQQARQQQQQPGQQDREHQQHGQPQHQDSPAKPNDRKPGKSSEPNRP
jgi:hypothetical protein